jgi:hypothetical protein
MALGSSAMSMEAHVFFRGKLPTKAALSRTMKELGFPFSITPSTGSLERQSGFMPMKRRGEETGVEFDVYSDHAAVEEFADVGVDAGFEHRASLRWGGDFQEAVAGMSAAAALAKLMNGVVFDEAEDKLLSADEAIAVARKNLQELVKPEDAKHPGTRPADLKRYLKPLLKQRSDLVLIGRLLIIRPVRHIVRGVFFDRTSDKYQFGLRLIVRLLVEPGDHEFLGSEIDIGLCRVWDPDLPALLFHVLEQDVFSKLANLTSLADVDRDLGLGSEQRIAGFGTTVTAHILAGRRERAREMIDSFAAQPGNKDRSQTWLRNQRAFLEQDAASLGTEARSWEAKVAKVHRLGDAWEPSPFPIEVPEAERAQRCDEPQFPARPWIAPPPGLVNAPPTQPGEIGFASKLLLRRSGLVLAVALTRQEAAERHRTRQDYVLAMRRPDESLLVVRHLTGWSPHDPEQPRNPAYVPCRSYHVELHGSEGRFLHASIDEEIERPRVLRMWSINIYRKFGYCNVWQMHNDTRARTIEIHDNRKASDSYTKRPMTDAEFDLCEFAEPEFEDFNEMLQRVETFLQMEGVEPLRDEAAS